MVTGLWACASEECVCFSTAVPLEGERRHLHTTFKIREKKKKERINHSRVGAEMPASEQGPTSRYFQGAILLAQLLDGLPKLLTPFLLQGTTCERTFLDS